MYQINYQTNLDIIPETLNANQQLTTVLAPFFNAFDTDRITFENIFAGNSMTLNGDSINIASQEFIRLISLPNTNTTIDVSFIKEFVLYDKELHKHLLLKNIYKYCENFYSYPIIYALLIQKLIDDIHSSLDQPNVEDIKNNIIDEYSKLIQHLYNVCGYSFNLSNFRDQADMSKTIVSDFIKEFKNFIINVKNAIRTLQDIFTPVFNYDVYERIPYNP
jgi:hypothetical protein